MSVSETGSDQRRGVVVVGGGIAGLYCARLLAEAGQSGIVLLEMSPALGGRIETGDLRGFIEESPATRPAFKAEFGPMRFELPIQPRFRKLCCELGIRFGGFDPPSSPMPPVVYSLPAQESEPDGVTPLRPYELLKLGVYKMFDKETQVVLGSGGYEVILAPGDDQAGWLARLRDDAPPGAPDGFEWLRGNSKSVVSGEPLWRMGLGNALGEVLSPMAVQFIQNYGTFYHLLPRNPNAVEWAIFWLRLFKLGSGSLSEIPAGVRTVVERLQAELESKWRESIELRPNQRVVEVRASASDPALVEVAVLDEADPERKPYTVTADHVILGLPKGPLRELSSGFPKEVSDALKWVDGFTLLKVFLASRIPAWWPSDSKPVSQQDAWLMSTREAHYFRDGGNAMTLLYMDDPEAQKWSHFIQEPTSHDQAEYRGNLPLKRQLVRFVLEQQRDVADYLIPKPAQPREERVDATDQMAAALLRLIERLDVVEDFPELQGSQLEAYSALSQAVKELLRDPSRLAPKFFADVSDYAIRDWSRPPYSAGCHAWIPGARSWEMRVLLRAFALDGGSENHAHICGEAYSDYQGFIEGALRSAADAVATVLGQPPEHSGAF